MKIAYCLSGVALATLVIACVWDASAQEPHGEANGKGLPPAAPLSLAAQFGKGAYVIILGGEQAGRETFDIEKTPDGTVAASGHTQFAVGSVKILFETELDMDATGVPSRAVVKGDAGGSAISRSITFKDGTATVASDGGTQQIPYTKGASFIAANVFYPIALAIVRYDAARGGQQEISIFPSSSLIVERTARDEVQPAGIASAPKPLAFDRYSAKVGPASFTVWVDDRGRVAAIAVPAQKFLAVRDEYAALGSQLAAAVAPREAAPPDYSAPAGASFTAEEVTIHAKDYTLAGTLLLPKARQRPLPAVVTITGSGQQTRDEALPLPGLENYKPFRQVAEALASRGIAVLRVDDRGVGGSTGRETLAAATSSDFAEDVRAEVAYLRSRAEIDPARIALVGHSEGGIIAPMVAAGDPRIAAIVLMAGTSKRGDAVLVDQMNDALLHEPLLSDADKTRQRDEQQAMLRAIAEGKDLSAYPESARSPWLKEFILYDPLPTLRKVRQPILIVQGELDRQVTAEQAAALEKAAREAGNKDVTARVFPGLNHLFLPAKTGAFSEYSSLATTTIGDDVLATMSDWLAKRLGVGP